MTFEELIIQHNLNPEEISQCQDYLLVLRMKQKGIDHTTMNSLINNWDTLQMIIRKINFIFK